MRRLVFSAESRRDLLEIWTYISRRNLTAADRLIERIESDAARLTEMPGMGHRRNDVANPQYRFWRVKPYIIAYRFDAATLTVVRGVHGARDFRKIFGPRRK